jgi:hypothetical protein
MVGSQEERKNATRIMHRCQRRGEIGCLVFDEGEGLINQGCKEVGRLHAYPHTKLAGVSTVETVAHAEDHRDYLKYRASARFSGRLVFVVHGGLFDIIGNKPKLLRA